MIPIPWAKILGRCTALLLLATLAGCVGPQSTAFLRSGDNTCPYAFDGDCDEPGRGTGLCAARTDTKDCSNPNPGPNSCQFAFDGECDHPRVGTGVCPPNTDVADCRPGNRASGQNSCRFAFDGECDHPGVGTGACASNTDVADCQSTASLIGENSCQFAFDGECDHPGVGTGACRPNTDVADCRGGGVAAVPPLGGGRAPSIPRNATPRSSGTGFYINADGHLVTNFHVVRGCSAVGVMTESDVLPASPTFVDRTLDIAVLRTDDVPGATALLRSASDPSLGQKVYVVGYPLLGELTSINFTDGLVSSLTGFRGDAGALQTSAAVQPGNSGGPLLDEGGVVIGVVNSTLAEAENIGFAVRVEPLIQLLRREGVRFSAAGAMTPVRSETIAARAADYTFPILCYGR